MPFKIQKPMRFGDCDLTGIAYHPAYLSMLVDVNEAMFASFGVTWKELMFERQLGLPSVKMNIEFKKPAVYGDVLEFNVHVRRIGKSSLDLYTVVTVEGEVIWTIEQLIVMTSTKDHKSHSWPDDCRKGLELYLHPEMAA
ncbi:acyl-CoA thioesterase [Alloyangia pacifica]|uniref:4-hydroxybenzoyl-CoA thioesterase n=1 Tax=Alloyangia pacifica TaxID=311180 RepID=A0A1I6UHT1_9RHOB|nr:thioesterase family protein [Alloyangia pacifica]SDH70542.1 4-hydroxybenzoyl-CoA thioesterase [Alloyangia pacifica]SFT00992.1 4-hydroxybenzoyl-CoA thioesterase [Alloyangia pacifica]